MDFISKIPDWTDWSAAEKWLRASLVALGRVKPGSIAEADFFPVEADAFGSLESGLFGRYAQPGFRAFALALYLADLASYPMPRDQVSFQRLLHVVHAYPTGLRVFFAAIEGAGLLPVGYTGYFPIAESTLERLEHADALFLDRTVPPLQNGSLGDCVYVFNYSLIEPLRRSSFSRRLLQSLAADLTRFHPRGMGSLVVSPSGARVAERFGMKRAATLEFEGAPEWVYTAWRPSAGPGFA